MIPEKNIIFIKGLPYPPTPYREPSFSIAKEIKFPLYKLMYHMNV
jgi:hypothetical protein